MSSDTPVDRSRSPGRANAAPGAATGEPLVDARGPRFAASVTSVVLAAVLLLSSGALLAVQAVVFAAGAVAGPRRSPYGWVFQRVIRPRLGPPAELEGAAPLRFAQATGLVFAAVGTVGYLTHLTVLGVVATAAAFGAAFLNAAFGYCLGCELYLLLRRIAPRRPATPPT